jgi:DNA polymerase III subunit gamma/tau
MGQALYRKYRSKSLSEIVGQEHITTTLSNALKNGRISHAYLFTGPRGVGKTSIARILAYEVNGLPYDENATHLDVIEIDAASNRRIDEIRELRERVHTSPSSAKYKVYIIDEVHMLTKEAFNALLKTLEEPPAHAIFILATTEAHKLPETIISRTQRYTFKPIDRAKAVEHLRYIAKKENISINDAALDLIAAHGDGSFRDSISLLDQAQHMQGDIKHEDIQRMLGIAPEDAIEDLLKTVQTGDLSMLLGNVASLRERGYHAAGVAKQLSGRIRSELLSGAGLLDPSTATKLLTKLIDVPASHDPETLLELVLLEAIVGQDTTVLRNDVTPKKAAKPKESAPEETAKPAVIVPAPETSPVELPKENINHPSSDTAVDDAMWAEVLRTIKQKHNTLYSLARMAVPQFMDDRVILAFEFPFHQKQINDNKNKQLISETLLKLAGRPITVDCIVDKAAKKAPSVKKPEVKKMTKIDGLETINNIFGGGEVLE